VGEVARVPLLRPTIAKPSRRRQRRPGKRRSTRDPVAADATVVITLQRWWRRQRRRLPLNGTDPLTLEPLRLPGQDVAAIAATCVVVYPPEPGARGIGFQARTLADYIEATGDLVNPCTRTPFTDADLWRIERLTGRSLRTRRSDLDALRDRLQRRRDVADYVADMSRDIAAGLAVAIRDSRSVSQVAQMLSPVAGLLLQLHESDASQARSFARTVCDALADTFVPELTAVFVTGLVDPDDTAATMTACRQAIVYKAVVDVLGGLADNLVDDIERFQQIQTMADDMQPSPSVADDVERIARFGAFCFHRFRAHMTRLTALAMLTE
jgi:hypothetical protein